MKYIRAALLLLLLLALREEAKAGKRSKRYYHPDMKLKMPALVERHGYPVETHNVTSSDGYIQTLHRIPTGKSQNGTRGTPVLIHHALLCSSVDWIILGPDKALGYILADAGYDVWLANARGNTYSRGHVSRTTNDPEYWEFSWHEIGAYDLPAAIDYILNTTEHEKLYYIGYSMGSTVFFVMMSEHPEYNDKVRALVSLGPAATFYTRPENNFIEIANGLGESTFRTAAKMLGMYEIWPRKRWFSNLGMKVCKDGLFTQIWCASVMEFICGKSTQTDLSMLPIFYSHTPAGASSRELLHFSQLIESKHFRQYDFGFEKNMRVYGSPEPPEYNLNNTKVPVALFYSDNDSLVTAKGTMISPYTGMINYMQLKVLGDKPLSRIGKNVKLSSCLRELIAHSRQNIEKLSEVLANVIGRYRVPHDSFNHLDFMWGKDANSLVYPQIIDILRQH